MEQRFTQTLKQELRQTDCENKVSKNTTKLHAKEYGKKTKLYKSCVYRDLKA